jgi:flagellar P-ring protein precursor FlgI
MYIIRVLIVIVGFLISFQGFCEGANYTKIKDLTRFISEKEFNLVGYGLVVGLAGTGDSKRNLNTQQAVKNALRSFGVNISEKDISSNNVASVMVTAKFKSFLENGSKIDVNVSSLGDARSLAGGTLLVTPLKGVDNKTYILAQGPVTVGGYKYEYNGNVYQKNHPTVGVVIGGGVVERASLSSLVSINNTVELILNESDVTTAWRLENTINRYFKEDIASALTSKKVIVNLPQGVKSNMRFLSELENIEILPSVESRIVVNERTGTIVAGGGVKLGKATISHGGIKLQIKSINTAEFSPLEVNLGGSNNGILVTNSNLDVTEDQVNAVETKDSSSVFDLVKALKKIHVSNKDVVVILQALKASGALHAELVVL